MAKRLTQEHPLHKKVVQLEELADKLGIEISFTGYHTIVKDKESGLEAKLVDNEGGYTVTEFPSVFEWKLRVED
jgi:hypothetical protein